MRGSFGLVLVLFGLLVELAHAVDVRHLRDLPMEWVQAIDLLLLLGLAWTMAAVAVRVLVRLGQTPEADLFINPEKFNS